MKAKSRLVTSPEHLITLPNTHNVIEYSGLVTSLGEDVHEKTCGETDSVLGLF